MVVPPLKSSIRCLQFRVTCRAGGECNSLHKHPGRRRRPEAVKEEEEEESKVQLYLTILISLAEERRTFIFSRSCRLFCRLLVFSRHIGGVKFSGKGGEVVELLRPVNIEFLGADWSEEGVEWREGKIK